MAGHQKPAPISSNDPTVIDAKPLRTLTPMFPAPLGLHTFTPPNAPSFVCVTPFGPYGGGAESGMPTGIPPFFAAPAAPGDPNQRPPFAVYMNGAAHGNGALKNAVFSPPASQTPIAVAKPGSRPRGRPRKHAKEDSGDTDTGKKKAKSRRAERIDADLMLLTASASDDPRESVEAVLMTFDALRRRLMQLDEAREAKQRHDLKAGSIMMNNDLRINKTKRIGDVPGIEVGDMFYFRIEMCLVGLNAQSIAGIDYMTAKFGDEEDPVAVSIVSAGVYENTEDDPDVLVYTGQGLSGKDDQKLERGNLALERSLHRGNEIRAIRSVRDYTCPTGKIYIYDGLYKIKESWVEKGKSGFKVFKYKLLREPGQTDSIVVWKRTEQWRENPSSRGHVILPDISNGVESRPVFLVNEIDDEKSPSHFTYTNTVHYRSSSMKKVQGCKCTSVCLPGDDNCSCAHRNAGDLPYSAAGLLVSRMPLLYECNDLCQCSSNCRNRLIQKGTQLHFEVFKTRDRGWGLRSWDPIRAGTFICEYAGDVIEKNSTIGGEEDEHVFQTRHIVQTFRWNYAPELLGEPSLADLDETVKSLPIMISTKYTGNISRFMNHSCSPNVFWQPVLYDHGDDEYPHIAFFAIKHIPPMTELTYDYGLSQGNDQTAKSKNCLCGSPRCRGSFG